MAESANTEAGVGQPPEIKPKITQAEGSAQLTPFQRDVTEPEAQLSLEKKFASVMGKSEAIRENEVLRKRAIEFIKMGVSEEHIVELFESGSSAPKEALDEFLKRVIKPAVKEGRIFGTEFHNFLNHFHELNISVSSIGRHFVSLGYSFDSAQWKLESEGVSPSAIKETILNSNSYEDFMKWREASHSDIHVAFPAANLDRIKSFFKDADVSEESINMIKPGRITRSHAGFPIAKMTYETSQKVFNKTFGIDDPTYSEALLSSLIKSTDVEDLSGTLAKAVRVGEELEEVGIHRDIITRLVRDSGDLQGFIQLLSKKDALVAKYAAEPVPELQKAIEAGSYPVLSLHPPDIELPLEYVNYSDAQIMMSMPVAFGKYVQIIRSNKGIRIECEINPKMTDGLYLEEKEVLVPVLDFQRVSWVE